MSCDFVRPCERCVKRNHPELCVSVPPRTVRQQAASDKPTGLESISSHSPPDSGSPSAATVFSNQSKHTLYTSPTGSGPLNYHGNLKAKPKPVRKVLPRPVPETPTDPIVILLHEVTGRLDSITNTDPISGESLLIGRNSSAAFIRSLYSVTDTVLPSGMTIEAALSLTNRTSIHPFGALWQSSSDLLDVFKALPDSRTCLKYYNAYKNATNHYVPTCIDFDEFEQRMCATLDVINEKGLSEAISKPTSLGIFRQNAWYGLWFAVLAAGCQASDTSPSERQLTTRVLGKHNTINFVALLTFLVACSFECLRAANYHVCISVEVIQTLLLLEVTLCNDSNPGVAWNLLGLTWRQAYGTGVSMPDSPIGTLADALW